MRLVIFLTSKFWLLLFFQPHLYNWNWDFEIDGRLLIANHLDQSNNLVTQTKTMDESVSTIWLCLLKYDLNVFTDWTVPGAPRDLSESCLLFEGNNSLAMDLTSEPYPRFPCRVPYWLSANGDALRRSTWTNFHIFIALIWNFSSVHLYGSQFLISFIKTLMEYSENSLHLAF
jgi:hypothetical protein